MPPLDLGGAASLEVLVGAAVVFPSILTEGPLLSTGIEKLIFNPLKPPSLSSHRTQHDRPAGHTVLQH